MTRRKESGKDAALPCAPERKAILPQSHDDIAALAFEQALAELERIVDELEKGTIALEDSIALYARGEALKAHCEQLLKGAEQRIEKITLDANGRVSGTQKLDVG